GQGVLRRPRGGRAVRRGLPEAARHGAVRVRLAADRQVDQLPVVHAAAGGLPAGPGAGRLTRSQVLLRRWRHTGAVRILVVDDDRPVLESLRRSLAFNGYEVDV